VRERRRPTATFLAALAVLLVSTACSGSGSGEATSAADTLTRRQKDSLVSTMPIPGAGAVGRAMEARDAANARADAHDSIR
jgi:ABC-type glycerol-3-phosphate transport system substrate-binding protein